MNNDNWVSLEELAAKWESDSAYLTAEHRLRPYFAVAKDIFELRQEMELTQDKLAELAKTHQSRISKLESADLDFKLSTLIRLAEALDAHVDIRVVKNFYVDNDTYRALFTQHVTTEREQQRPVIEPINFSAESVPEA